MKLQAFVVFILYTHLCFCFLSLHATVSEDTRRRILHRQEARLQLAKANYQLNRFQPPVQLPLNRKYVRYSSSTGNSYAYGFNNQRQVFMFSLLTAYTLQRTLIVNPWKLSSVHDSGEAIDEIPFDQIIDVDAITSHNVSLVTAKDLRITLNGKSEVELTIPYSVVGLQWDHIMSQVPNEVDIVTISGFWGSMISMIEPSDPIHHIRLLFLPSLYTRVIRNSAKEMIAWLRRQTPSPHSKVKVHTIHVRLGDKQLALVYDCKMCGWSIGNSFHEKFAILPKCIHKVVSSLVPSHQQQRCTKPHETKPNNPSFYCTSPLDYLSCLVERLQIQAETTVVYIATNKPYDDTIQRMKTYLSEHQIQCFTFQDLNYPKPISELQQHNMWISAVEQMIAVYSNEYVPSLTSTWDEYVMATRQLVNDSFMHKSPNNASAELYFQRFLTMHRSRKKQPQPQIDKDYLVSNVTITGHFFHKLIPAKLIQNRSHVIYAQAPKIN